MGQENGVQTMKVDYSSRRFEIHVMTIDCQQCQCCSQGSIVGGLFYAAGSVMHNPIGKRKKVCSTHDPSSPDRMNERLYSLFVSPVGVINMTGTNLVAADLHVVEPMCNTCIASVRADELPKFNPSSEFFHGMPRPACLKNPSLFQKKGIMHIKFARDHPRIGQGCPKVGRIWGGNMDFQIVTGLLDDVEDLTEGTKTLGQWIEQEAARFEALSPEEKASHQM